MSMPERLLATGLMRNSCTPSEGVHGLRAESYSQVQDELLWAEGSKSIAEQARGIDEAYSAPMLL